MREDTGKPSYSIIPLEGLDRVAYRAMIGEKKYSEKPGELNWKKADITDPVVHRRFVDAALRHLLQYVGGEKDEDHLAAAAWNCLAIMALEKIRNSGSLSSNQAPMKENHSQHQDADRQPEPNQ